jgi:hypothetical protein
MTYTMLLWYFLFNPFYDEEEITVCYNILRYIIFYISFPFTVIFDIISLPFHVLNVIRRILFGIEYSHWYVYDTLLRTRPEPVIVRYESFDSYQGIYGTNDP